jgi:hypothetical protein
MIAVTHCSRTDDRAVFAARDRHNVNYREILAEIMTSKRIASLRIAKSVTQPRSVIGLIIALSACVSQAAGPQTVTLAMETPKDFFAEKCFNLESGQQLTYRFSTRSPIEFNVHHHPEHGPAVFPDRLIVKSHHSKQIIAQATGEYCFMAKNVQEQPGAFDVVISYEITTP